MQGPTHSAWQARSSVRTCLSNIARRVLDICAVALIVVISTTAAFAQAPPLPGAPPVFSTVDENGVDLATGGYNLVMQDVSIGQVGNGGLAFERLWVGAGWRYNHIGTINSSGATYTVSIGGRSETFTLSGGTFMSDQAMGATLVIATNIYIYTLRDGTVALFDTNLAGGGMAFNANIARLTQITAPNGERLTYTYKAVTVQSVQARRLQSVNNNLGYQLHFDYENDTPTTSGQLTAWKTLTVVTAINNAIDYCAPNADDCTGMSVAWPTVTYSISNQFETITDALGRATRITYTGGVISDIRRPSSSNLDHIHVAFLAGRVQFISSGGETWLYSYSTGPGTRTNTMTNPLSQVRTVVMNSATDQVTSITDGGITIAYQYDANNRLTRVTHDNEDNYTQYAYDGRGNITQVTQVAKPGSGLSNIMTSASFPVACANSFTCNQPTSVTDENGNTTNFAYDAANGAALTVTLPDPDGGNPLPRPQARFAYGSFSAYYKQSAGAGVTAAASPVTLLTEVAGCATQADDDCDGAADETITTINYGSNGVANNRLPLFAVSGSGNGTLSARSDFTYDYIGNLLTTDGPLPGVNDITKFRYDAARQLVGAVGADPDGVGVRDLPAIRISYNLDGQATTIERGTVTSQSDPAWAAFSSLQQQNTVYDFIGRATLHTLTAGGSTFTAIQLSYDDANRLECSALRMNPAVYASLPASACTLSTQGSNGPDRITRITLNAADLVTQVTRAYGTSDAFNEWSATYTPNGLLATLTDAGSNVLTYEYDGFDRASKIRFPNASGAGSSTTDFEQYAYDTSGAPSNRLVQDRRRDGTTISYGYDNLNRVTSVTPSANGAPSTFTYDNFSRVITATASSRTLTYTYDQLSRVLSETQPLGTVSYQWDLANRRTQLTYPGGLDIQYDYDLSDLVTAIREETTTTLVSYAYDSLGRRTGITRNPGGTSTTETAAYDGASRLTQLVHNLASTADDLTLDFTYNAASEILTRTVSNSAYNWSAISPSVTEYTDNGLNQYVSIAGAGQAYDLRANLTTGGFTYDIFNRLVSGPSASTFSYDPAGRLYEAVGGGTTTRFLYDGAQIIAEYNESNQLQRRFVPGPALDDAVVWYEGADTSIRRWFATDERGSTVAVISNSGTAFARNSYDEYGMGAGTNAGRFQYTGQPWLPEAGLYNFRARAYSPSLGRFMQTDPILHSGGINLYGYVANNPVNSSDPWGLATDCGPGTVPVAQVAPGGGSGAGGCGPIIPNTGPPVDPIPGDGNAPVAPVPGPVNPPSPNPTAPPNVATGGMAPGRGTLTGGGGGTPRPRTREEWLDLEGGGLEDATLDFASVFPPVRLGGLAMRGMSGVGRLGRAICGCVEAGTLVATPEGLRPIEEIEIGDIVLAWDPETGETSPQRVTDLIRPEPKSLWRLETRDAEGNVEVFYATEDHPWFIEDAGWVETRGLQRHQRIETADNNGVLVVTISPTGRMEATYNLTVDGPHTFLVGENHAVVHNGCERLLAQFMRDVTGRIHGTLPRLRDLARLSRDQLEIAAAELRGSIAARRQNIIDLGEQGGHGARLSQERQILREIDRLLGP